MSNAQISLAQYADRPHHSRPAWAAWLAAQGDDRPRAREVISALLSPLLKYICGGLAFVSLMLGVALHMERVHGRKQAAQIEKLTAKLSEISSRKNEQKVVTHDRIIIAKRKGEDADRVAKKIEAAPLPGQCKTPSEVLQADI